MLKDMTQDSFVSSDATMPISDQLKSATNEVIKAAIEYEKISGRRLGITGEIGEVLVSEDQGLRLLKNPLAVGYDAIDPKSEKTYQIKTSRVDYQVGRIGTFSKHPFDYAIVAVLDSLYKIKEMYKSDFNTLEPILNKSPRRNPHLSEFKRVAEKIK